jgi:hypothetical protein
MHADSGKLDVALINWAYAVFGSHGPASIAQAFVSDNTDLKRRSGLAAGAAPDAVTAPASASRDTQDACRYNAQ